MVKKEILFFVDFDVFGPILFLFAPSRLSPPPPKKKKKKSRFPHGSLIIVLSKKSEQISDAGRGKRILDS